MEIGSRIRDLRIRKNLTQEELGERTDLTKGYISQVEHDQSSPSLETFFDILSVLGESPADFFREEPKDSLVYHEDDQVTYLDEEKGYRLKWLVPESNENEMEPVMIDFARTAFLKRSSLHRQKPLFTLLVVVSNYCWVNKLMLQRKARQFTFTQPSNINWSTPRRVVVSAC